MSVRIEHRKDKSIHVFIYGVPVRIPKPGEATVVTFGPPTVKTHRQYLGD